MDGLVDTARLARSLDEMIRIPSVNPFNGGGEGEAALAEYVARRLAECGAAVDVVEVAPGRPNVIATVPGGSGPSVMLAGHLDTVGVDGMENPFEARVGGGRIYGRGAVDMKGGLAAILEAAAVCAAADLEPLGDVVVGALCDEEYGMIGSRSIGEHGPKCDFGIVAEPTELRICPAHRGQVGMIVRTLGRAAHSSAPELGVNAIVQMAAVIDQLDRYQAALAARPGHPLCGHGTVSPGVIAGGTSASIVPETCELEIDRRTIPGETAEDVRRELEELLTDISASDRSFRYALVGPTWDVPALDLEADAPPLAVVAAAHRAVVGASPEIAAFPAATDAPNLGFPAVVYGPGSLQQAHSADEYVDLAQVETAARVFTHMILGGLPTSA